MGQETRPEIVILKQDSTLDSFRQQCYKTLSEGYYLHSYHVIPNLGSNAGGIDTAVFLLKEDNRYLKDRDTEFQREMQTARKQRLSANKD